MADKKEIFDYLRNRQKAAEIEAKVNGINLWVLLGAISVVVWQLIGSIDGAIWGQPQLILRALLCAEALYIFSWIGRGALRKREELRYSQFDLTEMESPFLVLLEGALLLLPPMLSLLLMGKSWAAITLGFWGVVVAGVGVSAIASHLVNFKTEKEKFPKPDFGLTTRADVLTNIVIGVILVFSFVEQGVFAWEHPGVFTVDVVKQLTLLAALYLLLVVTIERKLQSDRIAWTYELETELLLGIVSAEVAARRIEHRGLGPRLQDVMDRFFDDMDRRVDQLDLLIDQGRLKLEAIKDVPTEYTAERAARSQQATQEVSAHVEALDKDCSEFGEYLKKLEEKNTGAHKAILVPLLANLKVRHETYVERLRDAKIELRKLAV